jgi:hypothetical protein
MQNCIPSLLEGIRAQGRRREPAARGKEGGESAGAAARGKGGAARRREVSADRGGGAPVLLTRTPATSPSPTNLSMMASSLQLAGRGSRSMCAAGPRCRGSKMPLVLTGEMRGAGARRRRTRGRGVGARWRRRRCRPSLSSPRSCSEIVDSSSTRIHRAGGGSRQRYIGRFTFARLLTSAVASRRSCSGWSSGGGTSFPFSPSSPVNPGAVKRGGRSCCTPSSSSSSPPSRPEGRPPLRQGLARRAPPQQQRYCSLSCSSAARQREEGRRALAGAGGGQRMQQETVGALSPAREAGGACSRRRGDAYAIADLLLEVTL